VNEQPALDLSSQIRITKSAVKLISGRRTLISTEFCETPPVQKAIWARKKYFKISRPNYKAKVKDGHFFDAPCMACSQ